jgi:hypothetical protein
MVLFDDEAKGLVEARAAVAAWLHLERGLALKRAEAPVLPSVEPGVFLGSRVSRTGIAASRKLRRRFRRRVRRAAGQGPEALVRTLRSYRGLLLLTQSVGIFTTNGRAPRREVARK